MYGHISTVAFVGIEARRVEVEVRITSGKQSFTVVGLPDKAVGESRERVRSALHAIGLGLPWTRITVNLAPADLPKEGSHFDLPIALAMMVALEAITPDTIDRFAAVGELSLDGSIRAVPGALPAAIGANAMGKGLICPATSGAEAAWAGENVDIVAAPVAQPRLARVERSVTGVAIRVSWPPLDIAREQREEVAVAPPHRNLQEGMQPIESNAQRYDDATHDNRLDTVERDLEAGDAARQSG
jgi:predicted ATPase with chaperone activity